MTTITSEALQYAYDTVLERLDIAGEMDAAGKEVAYLFTAARFAVEASQRLDTLQAELAACRQMCQRVATESGDSVAWALKMGVQNGSIQLTPLDFRGWDEGCDCAECQQQRAVYAWLFGAVSDD